MRRISVMHVVIVSILFFVIGAFSQVSAGCKECEEVGKGKIPAKFIDKSVKQLPSGITVWDVEPAMKALKDKNAKILWVDTRPGSFYKQGTIKKSALLVCDKKGAAIPDKDKAHELSADRLKAEMIKIDPDAGNVTVVFFCQGPKCHRSYNAALRSVQEYGLDPSKVVWFRAGYPNLEKHFSSNPKLKKRIAKYLKGSNISS